MFADACLLQPIGMLLRLCERKQVRAEQPARDNVSRGDCVLLHAIDATGRGVGLLGIDAAVGRLHDLRFGIGALEEGVELASARVVQ